MALYLGNKNKVKIATPNGVYKLIIPEVVTDKIKLISSDNYILRDSNNLLLIAKESK